MGKVLKLNWKSLPEMFPRKTSVNHCLYQQGNVGVASQGDNPPIISNTCTVATVSDSSSPGRLSDLDMNGNIQPSGRMTTSAPVEVEKLSGGQVDETLHLTHPGNKKMMQVCYKLL